MRKKNKVTIPASAIEEARLEFDTVANVKRSPNYGVVLSQANYPPREEVFPGRYEPGGGISDTIPDQSYTIQELFEKSRTGLSVNNRRPVYSDEDLPPFERMDFADRMAFLDNLKEYRDEIEKQFKVNDALEREKVKKEEFEKQQANDATLAAKMKEVIKDAK